MPKKENEKKDITIRLSSSLFNLDSILFITDTFLGCVELGKKDNKYIPYADYKVSLDKIKSMRDLLNGLIDDQERKDD